MEAEMLLFAVLSCSGGGGGSCGLADGYVQRFEGTLSIGEVYFQADDSGAVTLTTCESGLAAAAREAGVDGDTVDAALYGGGDSGDSLYVTVTGSFTCDGFDGTFAWADAAPEDAVLPWATNESVCGW